jgi:hypothetical protein
LVKHHVEGNPSHTYAAEAMSRIGELTSKPVDGGSSGGVAGSGGGSPAAALF